MSRYQAPEPVRGLACTATALQRSAAGLACAAVVAVAATGCDPTSSDQAAPAGTVSAAAADSTAQASTDHACSAALQAVGDYGPDIIKDAIAGHETLDKIKIDLMLAVLKGAAAATGDPSVKQSIVSLAGDYMNLKESLHGKVDAAVEQQVDNGAARLKAQCGSAR